MRQSAEIHFAHDHPTAAGHFPGSPIIPGALLLDEVIDAITQTIDSDDVVIIRSAKFFRPVRPGDSIRVQWHSLTDGAVKFECRVADEDGLAAAGAIEIGRMQR